ncbi:MAG: hypothetical protein K0R57_2315 [Paenibacillaceae bacterium]|nr:hypothetical protein [Paenibacillaceae bacterium]
MKRFRKNTRGSASVYFIIVLVPIFLFQALFVDLIRIRLAARESEMSLKTGLRSVMSQYDQDLARYGLYGLQWDQDNSFSVFTGIINGNLDQQVNSSMRYLDTRLDSTASTLKPVYTLGNPEVLKRQITQEMKVKAPVEFTIELIDKFKKTGAASVFEQAANYSDNAKKLEELHWLREDALDEAWGAAQDLIVLTSASTALAQRELSSLQELAGKIGLRTIEEVQGSLAATEQSIQNLNNTVEANQRAVSQLQLSLFGLYSGPPSKGQAEMINAIFTEIGRLQSELVRLSGELNSLMVEKGKLTQLLADMAEYTARYAAAKMTISVKEAAVAAAYNKVAQALEKAVKAHNSWKAELDKLRQDGSAGDALPAEIFQFETLYTDVYFDTSKTGAAQIAAAFRGMMSRWSAVEWWHSAKWDELFKETGELNQLIAKFETQRKSQEAEREARNNAGKKEARESRSKINSTLGEMKQALGGCGLGPDPYQAIYDRLEGPGGLADKYKNYSKLTVLPSEGSSFPEAADPATSRGMDLIRQIGGWLTGFRDEWMINEYVLDKFNYRTSSVEANNDPNKTESQSKPSSHPLQGQEGEYVLYGFNSCAANQGAAYGELFLLLLGIRTVEALMEPRNQALQVGTPLLVVLAAAAEGSVKALRDVKILTDGGSVAVIQKLGAFKLTYKDFLRLFFLIHPNQNAVLTRVQALLEVNTGSDLTAATTYIQGTGITSVRLWFMPGLLQALNKTTGLGCQIAEGRCQIRRTAVYAYD